MTITFKQDAKKPKQSTIEDMPLGTLFAGIGDQSPNVYLRIPLGYVNLLTGAFFKHTTKSTAVFNHLSGSLVVEEILE